MEKEIKTNEYIEKVKKHLTNPPTNSDDYFDFYSWIEDNEPIEYKDVTDDIFEIAILSEPWTDIESFKPLDEKLRKILKKYNYLD